MKTKIKEYEFLQYSGKNLEILSLKKESITDAVRTINYFLIIFIIINYFLDNVRVLKQGIVSLT